MARVIDTDHVQTETRPASTGDGGKKFWSPLQLELSRWATLAIGLVLIVSAGIVVATNAPAWWKWLTSMTSPAQLRWLLALLPAGIIVNHMVYLLFSRRKQFSKALAPGVESEALADLYFARGPMLARYLLPAIASAVLCSTTIAALTQPREYVDWLWAPDSPVAASSVNQVPGTQAQAGGGASQSSPAKPGDASAAKIEDGSAAKPGDAPPVTEAEKKADATVSSSAVPTAATPSKHWPDEKTWGAQVLRGAVLGFLGAYLYMLLLLVDRARQRDVTSGLAVWAAAMPVLGPLMGGTAALLLSSGVDVSTGGSFTRDAVFFVAGMLPQSFAAFVQSSVRRLFQPNTPVALRTQPLTLLRGVGLEVEARLQEEGIHDVSALAYASPYSLIRSTTYAPKQIADWIDEALLIATVPNHWDALEKAGVTGAMDLAWYSGDGDSIKALATEVKMTEKMLENVVDRLDIDAQVADLQKLYWDGQSKKLDGEARSKAAPSAPDDAELQYKFVAGIVQDARDRLVAEVRKIDGVKKVTAVDDRVAVTVSGARRDAVAELLRAKKEIEQGDGGSKTAPAGGPEQSAQPAAPAQPAPAAPAVVADAVEVKCTLVQGISADARAALVADIGKIDGVKQVTPLDDGLAVTVSAAQRGAVVEQLRARQEITVVDGN